MKPELGALFAIPNGGHRHPLIGAQMKAEGVRAGMPDLCLPVGRGGYSALYIEMKRPKRPGQPAGKTGATQVQIHRMLRSHGNMVVITWGWEHAAKVIEDYLAQPRSSSMIDDHNPTNQRSGH